MEQTYMVLRNKELDILVTMVNEAIRAGYTPCGGIGQYFGTWAQAVLRSAK